MGRKTDAAGRRKGDLLSRGFEPITTKDWALLGLAILDILMLLGRDVYGEFLSETQRQIIYGIDLAIVGIFAIEFLAELGRASRKTQYVTAHWYNLVGIVPIATITFRAFRLVRILHIWVVRTFPSEGEATWTTALVRGIIGHYKDVLLEEITDPIILTSINAIEPPLVRAQFAARLGETLAERRDHLHGVVNEAVRSARGAKHILDFQYGRNLVHGITDAAIDSIVASLNSQELNEVISESIKDILDEVRQRVREKEYRIAGGTAFTPASRRD